MSEFELRKYVAPEMLMGTDVRLIAGSYFRNFNIKNVLIATDKNVKNLSWFNEVLESLTLEGISYYIFDKISPNSPDVEVMEGLEFFHDNNCDGIFAIGGGSIMDLAKGIGIVYSNHSHILDFEGVDRIPNPTPPIICLPTTAGTSSDVSQFAIIRDTRRNVKIAIISKSLVPDLTLIDPLVSASMDNYLTACSGMDALTHAVEAYVSNGNSPLTDFHALNGIKLIIENLENAYKNPTNLTYRYNMMIGSLEAGLAFSNASLGAVHAMAHSLGGYYDSPHGECNALLLPHIINYNFDSAQERFMRIGEMFNINTEKKTELIQSVLNFKAKLGLDYSLSKMGVRADDVPLLAKNAINDACILTNPRKASTKDLEVIFAESI